ncbi:PorT family protein [Myroides sp. NP-2]|uniref:porin family protein n=1 Tax=Myroides sp. NP-2 TaxID=2759945 RepID=UPI0015FB83D5|nr:porin family protein [Myroides sp. NP-2]MBB1148722.1 PorT family protein [Myroides sp. NP-2]
MKHLYFLCFFCLISSFSFAQQVEVDEVTRKQDSIAALDFKYREDQFYFGISHNLMQGKPKGYASSTVSLGVDFGFLRDFPLNKSRTIALAPGVGFSYQNLRNNFGLTADGAYTVVDNQKRNSLSLHMLDFPLELRWRNSTPASHKFWRAYVGVKASYVMGSRLKTSTDEYSVTLRGDDNINKWLFGMYVGAGFNTWNFYAYYGLNTIYKDAPIKNDPEKLRLFKVGVIFYIL